MKFKHYIESQTKIDEMFHYISDPQTKDGRKIDISEYRNAVITRAEQLMKEGHTNLRLKYVDVGASGRYLPEDEDVMVFGKMRPHEHNRREAIVIASSKSKGRKYKLWGGRRAVG